MLRSVRFVLRVALGIGIGVGVGVGATLAPMPLPSRAAADAGFTSALRISRSAYPLPDDVPNVIVHRPPSFDVSRPYELVVVLHGWSTCINVFVRGGRVACAPGGPLEDGWGVEERFDAAGRNALLIVPQLAYRSRVGHPGRFDREGFARAVLDETLAMVSDATGGATVDGAASVVVVAHSAGFETAFAMSRHAGLGAKLRRIALMDALYDVPEFFGRWARDDSRRSLVSLHIGGRTEANGLRLLRYARRAMGPAAVSHDPAESDLAEEIRTHRVVVARIHTEHTNALLLFLDDVIGS